VAAPRHHVVGEVWVPVEFGVCEYTLVFQRLTTWKHEPAGHAWSVLRPAIRRRATHPPHSTRPADAAVAQVLVVPICSTLALDPLAYEHFLSHCGVLDDALDVLAPITLVDAEAVETARRQIQSLVMAAEVQRIVEGITA
jgi:hypothetical protein